MKRLIIALLVTAMVVFSIGIAVADNDEVEHPDNPKQQGQGPNAATQISVLDYEEHPDNPKQQGLGPK